MTRLFTSRISALQSFQLFRFGAVFLSGVVLSKSGLSLEAIGHFETFLLLSGALTFFLVSGLVNGFLARFPTLTGEAGGRLIFQVAITLGLAGISSGLFAFFLTGWKETWQPGNEPFNRLALFVFMSTWPLGFLAEYILLVHQKFQQIFRNGLLLFCAWLLAVCVPVIMGLPLQSIFIGLAGLGIIRVAYLTLLLFQFGKIGWNATEFKGFLVVSLPLVGSVALSGSAEYIDGILIRHFFDDAAFAVFRYGARELPVSLLMANAFSAALLPVVAQQGKDALVQIRNGSRMLMHFLFPLSLALMVLAPLLFPVLFSESFNESAPIFCLYLLLVSSRLLFPQTILNAMNQSMEIFKASILEVVLNLALSLVLLRIWGLEGVALATVIAFAVDKWWLIMRCKKKLNFSLHQYSDLKLWGSYSLVLLVAFVAVRFWMAV